MTRTAFVLLLGVLVPAGGCKERNPAYCDVTPDCPGGQLCDPDAHRCYDPAAPDASIGCGQSSDCPVAAPICTSEECTPCQPGVDGDADCAERDPATAHCASDGRCVACLSADDCGGTTPVCDQATGTCRPCADHEECVFEVCNIGVGSCLSSDNVIYVDEGGTDGTGCGTPNMPCATISGPDGALDKVGGTRGTIRLRGGSYQENVDIDTGVSVAVIGKGATISPATSGPPVFTVAGGSTVVVDGLTVMLAIGGDASHGFRCESSSTIDLRRVTSRDNQGNGISASNCTVTVSRGLIRGNLGGGLYLSDSAFSVRNSFIVANGDAGASGSTFGGVYVANGLNKSPQEFDFNTVADNQSATTALSNGVQCTTATAMVARNDIVYANIGGIDTLSGNCAWAYSAVEGGVSGDNNISTNPMFANPPMVDFHLQAGSPCQDTADPAASETVDFDGDDRPEGNRRDRGADEVAP